MRLYWQFDVELCAAEAADYRFAPGNYVNAGFILIGGQLPAEARLQLDFGQNFRPVMRNQVDVSVFRLEEEGCARGYFPIEAARFYRHLARRADDPERPPEIIQHPHHNSSR